MPAILLLIEVDSSYSHSSDSCNIHQGVGTRSAGARMRDLPSGKEKGESGPLQNSLWRAVIKGGKYSCGHYIFNEALIRVDADHTGHLSCWTCKDISLVFPRNLYFSRPNHSWHWRMSSTEKAEDCLNFLTKVHALHEVIMKAVYFPQ